MQIGRFKITETKTKKMGSWNPSTQNFNKDALQKIIYTFIDTTVNETVLECYVIAETRNEHYQSIRKKQLSIKDKAVAELRNLLQFSNREIAEKLEYANFN